MTANFIQLKGLAPQIKPGIKIIKSTDYAQYKSSCELFEELQQDIKKHEAEAAALKLKSIERGLSKGAEEAKSRLANQILTSASSLVSQLSAIEKDLSNVVLNAVRKIVSEFDDEKVVFEAVKKGLGLVYNSQKVTIRVHPSVAPSLASRLNELNHDVNFLEITSDDRIQTTDCFLESDIGIVNASLDAQMNAIEIAIKSKLSIRDSGSQT